MTRRRNTAAALVFGAAILVGNGASAQGIEGLAGTWMGEVTGALIASDALTVEIELHGDHVDGQWSMPMPSVLVALGLPDGVLGGEVSGGGGMPPMLTFDVELLEGCAVVVTVGTIESDRWDGTWQAQGCQAAGIEIMDGGTLMVMRAGAVPALPLVGMLLLAALLARSGWRKLQDRR